MSEHRRNSYLGTPQAKRYQHALAERDAEIEKLKAAVAAERERWQAEVEQLRADFNDCNAERARWKAELAAERERCAEMCAALEELLAACEPEVNEKGAGGFLLARMSDARAAIRKGE